MSEHIKKALFKDAIFYNKGWHMDEVLEDLQPLLSAKEVRRLLRCSLPLVYRMAERGQIPCVRVPCPGEGTQKSRYLVRFKQSDVINFIEKHYNN